MRFADTRAVSSKVKTFMMQQGDFLQNLCIHMRLEQLIASTKDQTLKGKLLSQYERLVKPEHMGRIYKFLYAGKSELISRVLPFP